MKKAVVSGGTGYVGRFIVEDLLAAGYDVTVLNRTAPPEGYFSGAVAFARLQLGDTPVSPTLFDGASFFVHAAFDHVPGRYRGGEGDDPEGFRRRNAAGSIALFEAARAAGVSRAVFLSSRAVYGPRPPGVLLDEDDMPRPDTLYGLAKLEVEQALAALGGGAFHGVTLRVTGVYGPAGPGREHKWASLFADYLAGRPLPPRAGTEVHGSDVASAVRLVLEMPDPPSPVLNVSDLLLDWRDLLAIVRDLSGSLHELPPRADASAVNAMRTDRLRALGWKPGGMALLRLTVARLLGSSMGVG